MRRTVAATCVALLATLAALPTSVDAQPKFAVEIEGGRNAGLTPYLDNVVYTDGEFGGEEYAGSEPFRPYLADERSGWGSNVGLRLVSNGIVAGLTFRWFDVGVAEIHHRGSVPGSDNDELRPTRIRPDGTVDDRGVEYDELDDPVRIPVGRTKDANLFVAGVEGGYRFYVYRGDVDLFVPAVGSVVLARLGRRAAPFRPGLGARTGVSATFDFISVMSVVTGARLQGMATPSYWHRSDAAYRASELGQTTESALFSTQLSVSFDVALQFTIR